MIRSGPRRSPGKPVSGALISGALECSRIDADGRFISVGISTAFLFVIEIQECARGLATKLVGKQTAIVTHQLSGLAAPGKVKRFDDGPENALAPDTTAGCDLDERATVWHK